MNAPVQRVLRVQNVCLLYSLLPPLYSLPLEDSEHNTYLYLSDSTIHSGDSATLAVNDMLSGLTGIFKALCTGKQHHIVAVAPMDFCGTCD